MILGQIMSLSMCLTGVSSELLKKNKFNSPTGTYKLINLKTYIFL